jgi:hypothetical protein
MFYQKGKSWLFLAVLIWIFSVNPLLPWPAQGAEKAPDIPEGWQIVPRVGFAIEYGGFIVHQDDYASLMRRRVEIDLIQYRRHIFYLNFDEYTYFGTPADKWDFNLMKYRLALLGYRYDFGDFYLGVFARHECNNPVYTPKYRLLIDRERANLYYAGVEFLTKTMRLGMKDRGINFDSSQTFEFLLGRFNGAASISKVFYRENSNPEWFFNAAARLDIFRYRRLIPYVEGAVEAVTGPALRASPSVEVGVRYHLSRVDISPFFKWSRNQEFLTDQLGAAFSSPTTLAAKNALFGGARVEGLLDAETFKAAPGGSGLQFFPETHGHADYGLHLNQDFFKGHGDLELDFEVLRWEPWTAFFYTQLIFDSNNNNYKPDKVVYRMQYGLTYAWKKYFAEGFVDQSMRIDTWRFTGEQQRANLAGLRVGTMGMKPGHFNDGISFTGPTFQWLNKLDGQISAGHFFLNRDWQFLWDVTARAKWDVLRWYFVVPYVEGEIKWLAGGGDTRDALEGSVETGLRLHGVLDFAVYLRFNHRENVRFLHGPSDEQSIVGVKALF